MQTQHPTGPRGSPLTAVGFWEVVAVWVMVAFMSLAVFITYARLPVTEFYNVSRSGLEGGASRALTYLNYPVAFIAVVLIGFAFARLHAVGSAKSLVFKTWIGIVAVLALALSLVAAVPGIVNQADLDARLVNVIPALGVLLAIALTVIAIRVAGAGEAAPWGRGDRVRLVITGITVFLSLPWILANLGFYIGDIPLFAALFMSRQIPEGETLRAVHLGAHHGMDGIMFFLVGLWLSRELVRFKPNLLRMPIAVYLSLMMVYGLFIAAQDFWLEQIVKRGWVTVEIPNAVRPELTLAWGLIIIATVVLTVVLVRRSAPHDEVAVTQERARSFTSRKQAGTSP